MTAVYGGQDRHCRGRQHDYDVYQMLELTGGHEPKMHRYGDLLRAMLADQIAWIEITPIRAASPNKTAATAWRRPSRRRPSPGARGEGRG